MAGDLERLEAATAHLQAPFAALDMDALWANAEDMERRAKGKPIRLASKSVRCRELQRQVLKRDGFEGTLAYTLPEALWLAEQGFGDIVVAYPTADTDALKALVRLTEQRPEAKIAVMVDSVAQLELVQAAGPSSEAPVRICLDVDAGFWPLGGRLKLGVKRSPVRTPQQARHLAAEVCSREGLKLVGIMAYEAQIAGLGDSPAGKPWRARAIGALQRRSARELRERRAAVVAAVEELLELEFVNGGGTGSLQGTSSEKAVTELGAGSGLYGPALFDSYSAFKPRPAALFALPIVRKPYATAATALGGGYLASGPADAARLPSPHLPAGLRLDSQEGAGEVQTPLLGAAARQLHVGSRVWMRHAKAGELCERFNSLHLIEGDKVVQELPTYRGEGKCFL